MARGRLGRRAKSTARMAYLVNRRLGVPRRKAKRRANKAGRKIVARALGRRRRRRRRY